MLLGFDRVLSTRFYRYVRERMLPYEGRAAAAAPVPPALGSLAGVVDRNFLRVHVSDPAEKVVAAFAGSNAEVAVVLDDDGAVVGTLRARDLVRLMWGYYRK
jgi:CBS domain-containing protein